MCGISGFNWKDEEKVKEMLSCISYRGPDASGLFLDARVSLGHNRLSVIDLSEVANQPMRDNRGELTLIFNGEIYNFKELKKELHGEYEFKTESDSEVILAGYRKWGRKVADRLNGMFSFALFDSRDGSIFCARDHLGMKPFYYFWDGQRFIFSSEIPAILKHDIPRVLNKEAFNHYMRLLFTPGTLTMFEGIYKLPPSHTLTLIDGELVVESFGESEFPKTLLPYPEATVLLKEKVVGSVKRHLIADVPVGVYLSGGIDSSIVLASVARFLKHIKTFTVRFALEDEKEVEKFNADSDLARRTAAFFGTDHHELIVSTRDAIDTIEKVAHHNSDPISNPTSIAMFLLAQFAKKHVTVALTGNGGDELFGGYDRYRLALLGRVAYSRVGLFAKFMFQKDDKLNRIVAQDLFVPRGQVMKFYKKYMKGNDAAEALMSADRQTWLPEHFFMLSDKMSMASALEERMPLSDKELLEFSNTLPRRYKVDFFRTKKILKDAFQGEIPDFLFAQPKRGWFSPAAKWFRNKEFADFARKVLSPDYYEGTKGVFSWGEVEKMLEDHIEKKEYNLVPLWAMLTFQMWAKCHRVTL